MSDTWHPVVTTRLGAAPLRFKGRRLSRHERSDQGVFIELWERKSGGLTIAYSANHGAEWVADARTVPNLDAAATVLETICATMSSSPPNDIDAAITAHDLAGMIEQQCLRQAQVRRFLELAGEALDDWGLAQTGASRRR